MAQVQSAHPRAELTPFVRAYAQRRVGAEETGWSQLVPAQLEHILNFELGVLPGIHHKNRDIATQILMGGIQDDFSGVLELKPGVESFAVFFWPSGWSRLFQVPVREITNQFDDAVPFFGAGIRQVWNRLGEEASFAKRVAIMDAFLMKRLSQAAALNRVNAIMAHILHRQGTVVIPEAAASGGLAQRQAERLFRAEVGITPKMFARIARFQTAVDARLADPLRSWTEIAHQVGYYDQMHMIHDFAHFGRNNPTQVLLQMGDVRPVALVESKPAG